MTCQQEVLSVMDRFLTATDCRLFRSRGEEERAEEVWRVACDKINSGQLREGGSVYDGCEKYRDRDWLHRIRRWPPVMVDMMGDFLELRAPRAS